MTLMKHKGEQTMMPMSRYYAVDGEKLDMAAAIAVKEALPSEGDVQADALPAGKVASAWHMGPYEKLNETYAVVEAWIADEGLNTGPQSWEIYWTDPGSEPDSSKWKTEVVRQLDE
mgnify:CR=1 FL=1